jgi:alkaline phosphatase
MRVVHRALKGRSSEGNGFFLLVEASQSEVAHSVAHGHERWLVDDRAWWYGR